MTLRSSENNIRLQITELQSAAADAGFAFTAELLAGAATAARVELDLYTRAIQNEASQDTKASNPDDTLSPDGS